MWMDVEIPIGTYNIDDLEQTIQKQIEEVGGGDVRNLLEASSNTMKVSMKASVDVDFSTENSIGRLLGVGKLRLVSDETKVSATSRLIHNAVAFMFSDIRYVMNGVEVDAVRNLGICSTMKGYFSLTSSDTKTIQNAGWDVSTWLCPHVDAKGFFSVSIPLKMLLGFAEDFNSIIMNVTQELILKRSSDDKEAVYQTNIDEEVKVIINKVVWRVPQIKPTLRSELHLTKIADRNVLLEMSFRDWELHKYPTLPETTKHNWIIKTAPSLETPAILNGKKYPYEDLNVDFGANRYSTLYDMYAGFQKTYYNREGGGSLFEVTHFKLCLLMGIDCMYQENTIHKSGVDIRIEFTTKENVAANTIAYCLLLHDKLYEYSPFNKMVQRKYEYSGRGICCIFECSLGMMPRGHAQHHIILDRYIRHNGSHVYVIISFMSLSY
ncbi:hypothetical protein MML48_10g00008009 [Holotrichia oblita]|uniref:Uncharacterized protein n=1 Tax=Holotrichia oblita TaxID=644536 RepID=A0ACB9SGB6_HOLOL|nr:hypothetical protein MML48_10g00008009 [Holotrichia oblita]